MDTIKDSFPKGRPSQTDSLWKTFGSEERRLKERRKNMPAWVDPRGMVWIRQNDWDQIQQDLSNYQTLLKEIYESSKK